MAIILCKKNMLIGSDKEDNNDVHQDINQMYFNEDFNFEELLLVNNISKMTVNEELAWFILMMSICFSFIIGIIKFIPEWKNN
jgi:hypothetical protein